MFDALIVGGYTLECKYSAVFGDDGSLCLNNFELNCFSVKQVTHTLVVASLYLV